MAPWKVESYSPETQTHLNITQTSQDQLWRDVPQWDSFLRGLYPSPSVADTDGSQMNTCVLQNFTARHVCHVLTHNACFCPCGRCISKQWALSRSKKDSLLQYRSSHWDKNLYVLGTLWNTCHYTPAWQCHLFQKLCDWRMLVLRSLDVGVAYCFLSAAWFWNPNRQYVGKLLLIWRLKAALGLGCLMVLPYWWVMEKKPLLFHKYAFILESPTKSLESLCCSIKDEDVIGFNTPLWAASGWQSLIQIYWCPKETKSLFFSFNITLEV